MIAATGLPITPVDAWAFDAESARRTLLDQLRTAGLEGFGLEQRPAAVAAAGALVHYLRGTQKVDLAHVTRHRVSAASRRVAHRSDDAQASRDLEGSEGGRTGRCSTSSIGR